MDFKEIKFNGLCFLAPMAGVSDYAFRTIAKKHGAACVCGEMASSKGIVLGGQASIELIDLKDSSPFGIQLFGDEPKYMFEASKIASRYNPSFIDINMGCPAPKITKGNSGSALLKNLSLAGEIVSAVKEGAGDIPITVKIRKGFDLNDDVSVDAAKTAEKNGASAVTVHGRTRAQMYAPSVDLDCIKNVKSELKIPVIGNGDICSVNDAEHMFQYTGCDYVMIGRGALGNPWLFEQINYFLKNQKELPQPSLEEIITTMKEEINLLVEDKGEYIGFREARKHCGWYMKGLRGAADFRKRCNEICSFNDIDKLCNDILKSNQSI